MDAQPGLWTIFFAFQAVEVSRGDWSFFLICNTLAEVQGFRSAWRGFFQFDPCRDDCSCAYCHRRICVAVDDVNCHVVFQVSVAEKTPLRNESKRGPQR